MKRWWNIAFQIVATGGQVLNLYAPFIPVEYQGTAAAILTAAQGTIAVLAHSFNPDGTTAQVPYVPPQK